MPLCEIANFTFIKPKLRAKIRTNRHIIIIVRLQFIRAFISVFCDVPTTEIVHIDCLIISKRRINNLIVQTSNSHASTTRK